MRRTTSTTNHWTPTRTTRKSRDCWKSTRPPTSRWSARAATARTTCDDCFLSTWQEHVSEGVGFAQAEQENTYKDNKRSPWRTEDALTKTWPWNAYGRVTHLQTANSCQDWTSDRWWRVLVSWKDIKKFRNRELFYAYSCSFNNSCICKENIIMNRRISVELINVIQK